VLTGVTYRSLIAVAVVAAFHIGMAEYLLSRTGVPPVYWVYGFLVLAAPLGVRAFFTSGLRMPPVAAWGLGYLVISFVWFFPSTQSEIAWQEVQTRVLSVVFLLLVVFLVANGDTQRAVRRALVATTLVGVAFNLYELVDPFAFDPAGTGGRSAGLFGNANQSGAALIMGMVLGQDMVKPRYRLPFALVVGLGVFVTFSRASAVAWVIVVAFSVLARGEGRRTALQAAGAVLLVVVFLLSPLWRDLQSTLEARGVLNDNVLNRVAFFRGAGLDDVSTEGRWSAAALAWDVFAAQPIAGSGTGATSEAPFVLAPHNMYLDQMVEHGVLGIVVLPALVLAVAWGARGPARRVAVLFAIYISFRALFSHNILEERYVLLTFGVVAAMTLVSRQRGVTPVPAPLPASLPAPLPTPRLRPVARTRTRSAW